MLPDNLISSMCSVEAISERLSLIFPEGTDRRNYLTRDIPAKTVFTMLYVGAVEGADKWLRPDQVTRMTDEQSMKTSKAARAEWANFSLKPSKSDIPGRWYATNTREPIRDETLRNGLIRVGAAIERCGLPTTSSKPRYALSSHFAALFSPELKNELLLEHIKMWQREHMSSSALARVTLLRHAAETGGEEVVVRLPSGETRRMAPGPSSVITKAVIEEFAPRFLSNPAVVWISESGNKVVAQDEELAKKIGLRIAADRNLPDLILADLGAPGIRKMLIVFVEVVATDGPIDLLRKKALSRLAEKAGFQADQTAFVTALSDRSQATFRKVVGTLAWNSFAWFASEPENIIFLREGSSGFGGKLLDYFNRQ